MKRFILNILFNVLFHVISSEVNPDPVWIKNFFVGSLSRIPIPVFVSDPDQGKNKEKKKNHHNFPFIFVQKIPWNFHVILQQMVDSSF